MLLKLIQRAGGRDIEHPHRAAGVTSDEVSLVAPNTALHLHLLPEGHPRRGRGIGHGRGLIFRRGELITLRAGDEIPHSVYTFREAAGIGRGR